MRKLCGGEHGRGSHENDPPASTPARDEPLPDEVTDDVFGVAPYADRPRRDTTNGTDSIFTQEGGEQSILHLAGSVTAGYTGVLCFAVVDDEE